MLYWTVYFCASFDASFFAGESDQSSEMEFAVFAVTWRSVGARYVVFVVRTFTFAKAEPVSGFANITSILYCELLFAFVTVKMPSLNVTVSPEARSARPYPFSMANDSYFPFIPIVTDSEVSAR